MTPPRSFVGTMATSPLLRHAWRRRAVVAVLAIILALLSVFPRQYRAAATMVPSDPGSVGLGGVLGQLGAFAGLLGQQTAIEINLKVARSIDARAAVIRRMNLVQREGFADERAADRWLERKIDIRALRGGILQIETKDHDPVFARALIAAYTQAVRQRLAQLTQQQTAYKRSILEDLVGGASDRLARARGAYDSFRRGTRFVEPGSALGAIGTRVPSLQAQLKSQEIELQKARAFATDDNIAVRQILAEMEVIRRQLREAEVINQPGEPYSVDRVIGQTNQLQKLQRELSIAQGLYDSYSRYLEGTSLEDLTSNVNIRLLEPPYVDTALEFNTVPLAACLLVLMLGMACEVYLARPPVGALREVE